MKVTMSRSFSEDEFYIYFVEKSKGFNIALDINNKKLIEHMIEKLEEMVRVNFITERQLNNLRNSNVYKSFRFTLGVGYDGKNIDMYYEALKKDVDYFEYPLNLK